MLKITNVTTIVWGSYLATNKRGTLPAGAQVDATGYEREGYSYINSPMIGWVRSMDLRDVQIPIPPVIDGNLNLWRTLYGHERPADYPLGINYGSFDIQWIMEIAKEEKPAGFKLPGATVIAIKSLNDYNTVKWNWLLDQAGTRKILSQDEETQVIRLPVPCMSGGNVVNVLEETERFLRIETVKFDAPIPDTIRELPHLTHTWYGYTKAGALFRPAGGVLWPLLAKTSSAWVIKRGLVKL